MFSWGTVIILSIMLIVFIYLHFDGFKRIYQLWLCKRHKEIILFHYTSSKNADSILKSSRVLASKNKKNNNKCYFFILGKKPISGRKMKYNKLENTDAVIVVRGISKAQIKACEYGMQRYAVEHNGDFVFCDENETWKVDRITFEKRAYCQPRHKKCRSSNQQRG